MWARYLSSNRRATFQRKNERNSLSLSLSLYFSRQLFLLRLETLSLSLKLHSLFSVSYCCKHPALRSRPRIPHIGVFDSLISLSIRWFLHRHFLRRWIWIFCFGFSRKFFFFFIWLIFNSYLISVFFFLNMVSEIEIE